MSRVLNVAEIAKATEIVLKEHTKLIGTEHAL